MDPAAHKLIASGYNQVVELQSSQPNTPMQDGMTHRPVNFHLILVGQHYPDYLILELPHIYRWQDVLPELRRTDRLLMRTISAQGEVIAGYVNLIHATQFPDKLLFVSYPEHLESKPLRKQPRMQIDLRAQIQLNEPDAQLINGAVVDMSVQGFGFDFCGLLPCFEGQLIGQTVNLRLHYNDDDCEHLEARIRAVEERGPKLWRIGLEAEIAEDDRIDLMHRLLLNSRPITQMAEEQRSLRSIADNTLQD